MCIAITGPSGSGKTWLGERLAETGGRCSATSCSSVPGAGALVRVDVHLLEDGPSHAEYELTVTPTS